MVRAMDRDGWEAARGSWAWGGKQRGGEGEGDRCESDRIKVVNDSKFSC
jgi:hypothetical protein